MASRKVAVFKKLLIGGAFLAIVGWMALMSLISVQLVKNDGMQLRDIIGKGRQKRAISSSTKGSTGGAVYIRWGRSTCPAGLSQLVYAGFAGGQHWTHTGGGAGYVCMSDAPKYAAHTTNADATAYIYGVEFELIMSTGNILDKNNANPNALHDSDVKCAVCISQRPSKVMIPGTKECTPGWTMEYWGYLMTERYVHKGRTAFVCVDHAPEAGNEGGYRNDNGALMYHVQGHCGSLPCQPYVHGRELTCVVCTK